MIDEALGLKKEGQRGLSQRALPIRGSRTEPITYVHDLAIQSQALFKKQVERLKLPQKQLIFLTRKCICVIAGAEAMFADLGHFSVRSIQSVAELQDGLALFITVAKYLSPSRHDIDQVGITPDVQCTTDMLTSTRGLSSKDDKGTSSSLEADSCIMVVEHELEMKESKSAS
ncbi:hypothetical protein Syun_009825 [Stephania yunnanensis]|uniref:Tail specific protease domain-containing protein n=1 Tax=Stephania yunnanensis TaxID=152371 RepID=A0AAP0KF95_9MAGN